MDPFSAEGELLNIHNAFHQGQYQTVIDFDTTALSDSNKLAAHILKLRAKIALGQSEEVISEVDGRSVPAIVAVRALALQAGGHAEAALPLAEQLAATEGEDQAVQVLAGTVLQANGKIDQALELLGKHQGNLEAVALIVQIHLFKNRADLALKEVQTAKRWAQDSLLVNLAESWVGMRVGGEKYQTAYYVFEELASVPSTSSAASLIGQAISDLHLGRLPEAEVALKEALEKYPDNAEVIANALVLAAINGKDTAPLFAALQKAQPSHPLLTDVAEKSSLFDAAATKYAPRVSA